MHHMQYCMSCKTNGGKQTIPKPILGIAIDFAGLRVQFNQRLAGARCSFRFGCCHARSTGNLQTFLLTCTVTGPLLANDQRSGLNRLFLPEPSDFKGLFPSPEVPLAPIDAKHCIAATTNHNASLCLGLGCVWVSTACTHTHCHLRRPRDLSSPPGQLCYVQVCFCCSLAALLQPAVGLSRQALSSLWLPLRSCGRVPQYLQ